MNHMHHTQPPGAPRYASDAKDPVAEQRPFYAALDYLDRTVTELDVALGQLYQHTEPLCTPTAAQAVVGSLSSCPDNASQLTYRVHNVAGKIVALTDAVHSLQNSIDI